MARRAYVPRLSVILAVEGAPEYAVRAVESLQNQDIHDLQIIIAYRDLAAGVEHSLTTIADRDIHIDLIDVAGSSLGDCIAAGFDDVRAARVIVMGGDDWFAPGSLDAMLSVAAESDADVIFPQVMHDRYDIHRERHSRRSSLGDFSYDNRRELAGGMDRLIDSGLISCSRGVMARTELLAGAAPSHELSSPVVVMADVLALAQSAAGTEGATFHTPADAIAESFDPSMFVRACDDFKRLKGLLEGFGIDGASSTAAACDRLFYSHLVAAIENLCLSPHSVSSIERNARLRDMLDSEYTRSAVTSLKGSKNMGPMWKSVSAGKPFGCIVRAHVADFLNLSLNKTA